MLEEKNYPCLGESLYRTTLKNGLKLCLLPKPEFSEMSALLQVDFGALDPLPIDEETADNESPAGLAHFLEHKLFELPNHRDAAQKFSDLSVESNAFTGFEKTAFYFTSLGFNGQALELLQSFPMTADFDQESVDREKKIIEQEIDMYLDDVDCKLYNSILANLYPNTKLSNDIAGDRKSLSEITLNELENSHKAYYHPANMTLFVVGNFDKNILLTEVEKTQSKFTDSLTKLDKKPLNLTKNIKRKSTSFDTARPKLAFGIRLPELAKGSILRQKVGLRLFFSLLFGWTSRTYQSWYDQKLIDDSFDIDIEVSRRFQFILLTADTLQPIKLVNQIRESLKHFLISDDMNQEHLTLLKRETYGDFLRSLDSMEHLLTQLAAYETDEEAYLDLPTILNQLTLGDVKQIGQDLVREMEVSEFTIFPN
ncbi:EF-P 5-aminopentanol modification-associated protein YfmH [Streptococcus dentasini]